MTRREAVATILAVPVTVAVTGNLITAHTSELDMNDTSDASAITGAGILVLFNTRAGQSKRIAGFIAERVRSRGQTAEVVDLQDWGALATPGTAQPTIVVAGIQVGSHGTDVEAIVRSRQVHLSAAPSAFVSVSLSAAHPAKQQDAERYVGEFIDTTGWQPENTLAVAGALRYTRYKMVKRLMMKQIAGKDGLPVDTSRDHEFTDWKQVAAFADAFCSTLNAAV